MKYKTTSRRVSDSMIYLLAFIMLILAAGWCAGCSSVKKSTTKTETKVDSTRVVKSETVIKIDSTGKKETDSKHDYEKETVIYYDTVYLVNDVQRIKYITIKERGKTEIKIVEVAAKNTEAKETKVDSTKVVKQEKTEVKNKSKTSIPFWFWIIVAAVVAGGGFYSYKKFLS